VRLGHCDPDLRAALIEQSEKLWHTSNVFYSEPPVRLAQELVEASRFAERAFLCNSGAEANEAAIKLARKWASAQGRAPERRVILTCHGSFHGRTLAAVTATAQPKYQAGYEPLPGGFRYVDFNDLDALDAAMASGDVCAVMLEPVQGEGGVMPARDGYLAGVRALCDRHDALLILDEIQCGMGRTGPLFAHWGDGVVPTSSRWRKPSAAACRSARCWPGRKSPKRCNSARTAPPSAATRWPPRWRAWCCVSCNRKRSSRTLRNNRRHCATVLHALNRELDALRRSARTRPDARRRPRPPYAGRAGEILDHAANEGLLMLQAGPDVLRFVPALNIADDDIADGLARFGRALRAFAATSCMT
jgi:acetylornithine/N-succinyldiaminopimelate aminotransferase